MGEPAIYRLKKHLRRIIREVDLDFDDEYPYNLELIVINVSKYLGQKELLWYLNRLERLESEVPSIFYLCGEGMVLDAVINGLKSEDEEFSELAFFFLEKMAKLLSFHARLTGEPSIIWNVIYFFERFYEKGEKEFFFRAFSGFLRIEKENFIGGLEKYIRETPVRKGNRLEEGVRDFTKTIVETMKEHYGYKL